MSNPQLPFDGMGAEPTQLLPEGFLYVPDFISAEEEAALLASCESWTFDEVRMRGVVARRTVRHFGMTYNFDTRELLERAPWPPEHQWLQDRCAELAGIDSNDLREALATRYPPGASIGWHRDAPQFGPAVIGVSLLSSCRMRFRKGRVRAWETSEILLEPRSAYVIAGPARAIWQHHIPATAGLRYSVTFRTLRTGLRA